MDPIHKHPFGYLSKEFYTSLIRMYSSGRVALQPLMVETSVQCVPSAFWSRTPMIRQPQDPRCIVRIAPQVKGLGKSQARKVTMNRESNERDNIGKTCLRQWKDPVL